MDLASYRGRRISAEDVAFVQALITAHPDASRRALSQQLCAAWGWTQCNGAPRDLVCRGLMLALHRAGQITLPPVRRTPPNPLAQRPIPPAITLTPSPVRGTLASIGPLDFRLVRRTPEEPRFNALIQHYHYLGYTQPVGAHLKYLVYAGEALVAAFAWSSAPRHLGPRDRYLGWSAPARRRNLHRVAINTRFLIPPWVEVRYLASHLLSRMTRRLSRDWDTAYGHPLVWAETFVDSTRYRGTCYRAANWRYLGETTGRGKDDHTHRQNRSRKMVWGYPLTPAFRDALAR
jgi:hypothetical protein